jgi:tetratricopeptide (TPR) repeat protein
MDDYWRGNFLNPQQPKLWNETVQEYPTTPEPYMLEIGEEFDKLLKDFNIPLGASLLELAGGVGHLSGYLASKGYKTTLTDFSEEMIKKAKEYYERNELKGDFLLLDMFKLSKEAVGSHDVVFILRVFDHYDGWQVLQVLENMAKIATKLVVVLAQNPACIPYLLWHRAAFRRGEFKWGLSILRDSLKDLAELAGLEVIEERFFCKTVCKIFTDYVNQEKDDLSLQLGAYDTTSEDQKHLKVLVARPRKGEIGLEERAFLLQKVLKVELEALRKNYYLDTSALKERIAKLEDETRLITARQFVYFEHKYDRAEAILENLLRNQDKHPEFNYLMAFCLHMQSKDLARALLHYSLALEQAYDEFAVRYHRGLLHVKMGNVEQARIDLMRAVELKPDNEGARQALQQLSSSMATGTK